MPHLSDRDVQRFTNVDYRDRVALVMTVAEQIIAVGRYDVDRGGPGRGGLPGPGRPPGPWHRPAAARAPRPGGPGAGVDRFVAEMLPENRRMIQVFREQGYQVKGGWTRA